MDGESKPDYLESLMSGFSVKFSDKVYYLQLTDTSRLSLPKQDRGSNPSPSATQSGLRKDFARFAPKYAKNSRIQRLFPDKPDFGQRTARHRMRYCPGFSPERTCAVRF